MKRIHWSAGAMHSSKRQKRVEEEVVAKNVVAEEDEGGMPPFPFRMNASASVYASNNCVYFNDDVTPESIFALNKELRATADKMLVIAAVHKHAPQPIWLHLTTNGGEIYAALSAIDCIKTLPVPVYTVVDGFVASAGTIISICGAKRFILPNAYMLLHELRSSMWGKFSDINDELVNLKKIMEHIIRLYIEHTGMTRKALEKMLTKDLIWDANECLSKGVVDTVFSGYLAHA
jgi:ATP-dependent Clp protease protease subunit